MVGKWAGMFQHLPLVGRNNNRGRMGKGAASPAKLWRKARNAPSAPALWWREA
jgi:hypothetical protein